MLKKLSVLMGYKLKAKDGEMGKVKDAYFEDCSWSIRYIVSDTGKWFLGKKVLMIPLVLGRPDEKRKEIPVDLTQAQIKQCPNIDVTKPVSRQQEMDLHRFFKWLPYWDPSDRNEIGGTIPPDYEAGKNNQKGLKIPSGGDDVKQCHLRSLAEVKKYFIFARDGGDIGKVKDFIIEIPAWANRYVVVDTGNWLPGKKVLISPQWIEKIRWVEQRVYVDLSREEIESSPEYDPSKPVERQYDVELHKHYRRSRNWKKP
ncbi:MAG: PRC-barrel domain-containing protein [Candidatus Aminicenantes bacterium]